MDDAHINHAFLDDVLTGAAVDHYYHFGVASDDPILEADVRAVEQHVPEDWHLGSDRRRRALALWALLSLDEADEITGAPPALREAALRRRTLARAAKPLMTGRAGALLTLSYLGAVKSIPSYNVMGLAKASLEANVRFLAADLGPHNIRVNGISAGPIKTLAAAGIAGFRKMLSRVAEVAPLRRNVTLEDVGNAAAFLCSERGRNISGQAINVDGAMRVH